MGDETSSFLQGVKPHICGLDVMASTIGNGDKQAQTTINGPIIFLARVLDIVYVIGLPRAGP